MMVIKVSYHIFCSGIYMYDEGANKCSYFKHYEDRVSCTRQFIVQNLISYKLESVIDKNGYHTTPIKN